MNESIVIKLVNFILDKILSLDPQKAYLLEQLQNKSLAIGINDFSMCFCFNPAKDRLTFELIESINAENLLSANSGTLVAMALSHNPQSYIQKGAVEFTGNLHILEYYSYFFQTIRPDLIFILTSGDTTSFSSFLSKPLDVIKNWFTVSKTRFPYELREYIQYEKELSPCKEEVEDFFSDIQVLKQDLERIAAKINRHLNTYGDQHG